MPTIADHCKSYTAPHPVNIDDQITEQQHDNPQPDQCITISRAVNAAAPINYPHWADRSRTRKHNSGGEHFLGLRRWKAAQDDVIVQLDLTRLDDFDERDHEIVEGRTHIRLGLTSTAYIISGPDEPEVPLALDTDLDAADCRKLAAHLLSAADRLEDLGGTR